MSTRSTFDDEFLREVVVDAVEGIISVDGDGSIVFANRSVERLLGRDTDALIGRSVECLFPDEQEAPLETVRLAADGAASGGPRGGTDLTLVHADGHEVPITLTVEAADYDQTRFFTLRFRERTTREESGPPRVQEGGESLPETVFERSNDAILVFESTGDAVVACNPSACELLGYSREELLSLDPAEIHPRDTDSFSAFVADLFEEGSACTDGIDYLTSDGEVVPVEISGSMIEFGGEPHVLANVRDVSERVRQERELARYRTIVEAVGEGVYATDEDLRFTVVNDGMAELTGYDREELVGMSIADLLAGEAEDVAPEEYEPFLTAEARTVVDAESARAVRGALRNGDRDVITLEAPIHTRSDEIVPVEVRISELPAGADVGGRGTTGVVIDVSERKEHDRRLRELNEASRELTRAEDRDVIARTTLDAVDRILGFEHSCVRALDEDRNALEPVAMTGAAERLTESRPAYDLEASLAGRAYRQGEPVTGGVGDVRSGSSEASLHLPLGDHGTLSVFDPSAGDGDRGFAETDVELARVLAATVTAHLDRAERERTLHERRRECRHQRDQLDMLNRINTLVQGIIQELVDVGTREGIEERVCRQLAESNLFRSAWIAEVSGGGDDVLAKAGAGIDGGYLEAVDRMSVSRMGNGTVEQAIETGEIGIERLYRVDGNATEQDAEPPAEGVEVTAAIPLGYGDHIYGALVVNADHEDAFGEQAQAGLETLGDAIGFSINAFRNRELLESDELVELEFDVTDRANLPVYFADELGCHCRLEGTAPAEGQGYLCYLRIEGASAEAALEAAEAMDAITTSRVISEEADDGGCLLEVGRTESAPKTMNDVGASIRSATAEDGHGTIVIEAPRSADLREVIEALQSLYPESELAAKRTVDRSVQTAADLRNAVQDRLTEKQQQAAKLAYHAGYYDWPRESTAEEIADSAGVASATLHQHLRRAEWKLMTAFFGGTHEHPG